MEIEQLDGSAHLAAAHDALEGHRWQEAFELLTRADRDGRLSASDLEALAEAAWFTAQPDLAMEAKERAFKAYIVDKNKARAAAVAFDLSREYHNKQKFSIASAWAARGERLLEGEPEGFAHAYQAVAKSLAAQHAGDVELAIRLAGRAVELGTRFDDADIRAWGLLQQGRLLIAGGRTNEGFSLLEEATIAAVNGELNPFMAGVLLHDLVLSRHNRLQAGQRVDRGHPPVVRAAVNQRLPGHLPGPPRGDRCLAGRAGPSRAGAAAGHRGARRVRCDVAAGRRVLRAWGDPLPAG